MVDAIVGRERRPAHDGRREGGAEREQHRGGRGRRRDERRVPQLRAADGEHRDERDDVRDPDEQLVPVQRLAAAERDLYPSPLREYLKL